MPLRADGTATVLESSVGVPGSALEAMKLLDED